MQSPAGITVGGQHFDHVSFIIGLALAISSSVFIGSSFIIKKIALRKITASGSVRASAGGFAYLKQWLWWLGLITITNPLIFLIFLCWTDVVLPAYLGSFTRVGIGEAANLLAYAFAPAALVTPLGALSVLVAAVLASRFLNEHLNLIGKIGCCLCVIGSVIIVIHSPKSEETKDFEELTSKLHDYVFISYVVVIFLVTLSAKLFFVPRYGNTNICVYLLMCSAIGSLTVVFCKAVALGVKENIVGDANNFTNYIFWILLITAVICIMIQMNYLNKSLDIFNTGIVTPVYYVMFTILVIMASGILFKEWSNMEFDDILGCVCGFLVVVIAVFMLNAFKDFNITLKNLNLNSRRQRSLNDVERPIENGDYTNVTTGTLRNS